MSNEGPSNRVGNVQQSQSTPRGLLNQPRGQGKPFPKAEKVPQKLKPNGLNQLDFKQDPLLNGAWVFVMAGAGGSHSYTVHHPIGVTPLDDDEWVMTPSGDISQLLTNRESPNRKKIEELRKDFVFSKAIEAKLLLREEDGTIRLPSGTERKPVSDFLNKVKGNQEELPEGIKDTDLEEERAFRAFSRSAPIVKAASEAYRDDFETCSGSFGETKQEPIRGAKGITEGQVRTLLLKKMFRD
jgi:hypothetical protein